MTREELIAALERATGPSRELDFWIGIRTEMPPCPYTDTELQADIARAGIDGMHIEHSYTASIDAALMLVPEGHCVLLAFGSDRAVCDVHTKPLGDPSGEWPAHAQAATPALALCIAALRAREARDDGR